MTIANWMYTIGLALLFSSVLVMIAALSGWLL